MNLKGTTTDGRMDTLGADQLNTLQSITVSRRLNQIDRIRAKGIGDHISLPQLVVCGAQSAGKSSVLEGITGLPFPRQDGVCTKFATEIILRHTQNEISITASIIPHNGRTAATADELRNYRRRLSGYDELPETINDAACCMGIRGFVGSGDSAPAFSADVLRIEVVGDVGLHLTVVDLPGLVSVENEEHDAHDIKLVEDLVDSYLQSSRTIILAVVQATNDIATQPIIQRARHFDRAGERTVGIITKPDLINKGTEGRIALLTNNLDSTRLKHGFFLLKNPSPQQLEEGISLSERKRQEADFFRSPPWREHGIDLSRVGVDRLQPFLQSLLGDHIERELPKVCAEVRLLLDKTKIQLQDLGQERSTVSEQRFFLSKLSMDFVGLTQAALDGTYQHIASDFFGYDENGISRNRFRGQIHTLNSLFADYMRDKSQKRKMGRVPIDDLFESSADSEEGRAKEDKYDHSSDADEPFYMNETEFDRWIKKIYRNTRGLELPGNYNNALLTELFHEQSSRWPGIAKRHIHRVHEETSTFVTRALAHVVREEHIRRDIHKILDRSLQSNLDTALDELRKLCDDERAQLITYNHYYTDNIQKARHDRANTVLEHALQSVSDDWGKIHVSNTPHDLAKLLGSLQNHVVVNMEQQACEEAKAGLAAYYKVDMKTFVDNVCRQVVERHIVRNLRHLFTPTDVLAFSDEEVELIASEPNSRQDRRKELKILEKHLEESLFELRS
ncbi:dynamin family protein [Histoplasma capsulatum var. duboisii H88]|nr:dynamin family protein [Histoplasma capsulatum var. duboisii H88]